MKKSKKPVRKAATPALRRTRAEARRRHSEARSVAAALAAAPAPPVEAPPLADEPSAFAADVARALRADDAMALPAVAVRESSAAGAYTRPVFSL